MKFTKMHGLGNDYLYIYANEVPDDVEKLAIKYSERHFGVGSDGLIYILPSDVVDFKMRIFNADGSEANMCGNGIRCVGKYVYDRGFTNKTEVRIDTLSGIKTLKLTVDKSAAEGNQVSQVSVDMGRVRVDSEQEIEVNCGFSFDKEAKRFVCLSERAGQKVLCGAEECGGQEAGTGTGTGTGTGKPCCVPFLPVDMGNPHAVVFVSNADNVPLDIVGPKIEKHPAFPDGVNVEFIHVINPSEIRMRVWERGSGITWACGTGSCASVAAAISCNLCQHNTDITVHLDGGDLTVNIDNDNNVKMTGPAAFVCDGETL